LFEVISKQSGGVRRPPRLGVPDWWRRRAASEGHEQAQPPVEPPAKDLPAEPVGRRLREREEEAGGEPGPAGEAVRGGLSLGMREGRICLTLTPIAGVVVVGTALLIVVGSYAVGRSLGWRDARRAAVAEGDEVAVVRQSEPDPSVLLGLATDAASSPQSGSGGRAAGGGVAGSGDDGLELGKTYLVIQTFAPSARADAVRAQGFLATREVPTVLRRVSNGYLLVARKAFDWDNVQDRGKFESFRRSVVALGQLYASEKHRGGYDFKDCYPSTYRG
jgi:hypothetical protein